MIPSWTKCLQILVMLAIAGFTLVVVSGFWHVLALLIIAAVVALIWQNSRIRRR
jgi:hypothetical protein